MLFRSFHLSNAGDEAVLVGPGGITVDQVAYSTTLGFPSQTSGEGRSLALKPGAYDHLLNDAGDNWTQSTAPIPGGCGDKGSPGTMNP